MLIGYMKSALSLLAVLGILGSTLMSANSVHSRSLEIELCNDADVPVSGEFDSITGKEHTSCDHERLFFPKSYEELEASTRVFHEKDNLYIAYDTDGKVYRCELDNTDITLWLWTCRRDRSLE